jgi:hypothetical protein
MIEGFYVEDGSNNREPSESDISEAFPESDDDDLLTEYQRNVDNYDLYIKSKFYRDSPI